jgi:hypothetical protein
MDACNHHAAMPQNDKTEQVVHAEDATQVIEDLIQQIESGKLKNFALRYQDREGWHDLTFGYETEEERAAALCQLRRLLGQLH